jgi:hypothetical protein
MTMDDKKRTHLTMTLWSEKELVNANKMTTAPFGYIGQFLFPMNRFLQILGPQLGSFVGTSDT